MSPRIRHWGRVRISADIPIPVQLREHGESRGQLGREERDGLAWRYVSSSEGARFGALYVRWIVSRGGTRIRSPSGVPTALSRFRSHRSLIVHPAPRITRAPVPNRAMYVRGTDGGALSAYEAMVMDQATWTHVGA